MKQLYSFLFLILLFTISLKAQDGLGVWTTTTTGVGPVYAIVVDPSNTDIMYSGSLTLGVYKSTDAGGTWNAMNTGLTNTAVLSLAISASNPQVLYAGINVGANDGVYKTTDGGASWTRMVTGIQETGKGIQGVAVDPTNANVAYIAVFDGVTDSPVGLYKTSDGGANWNPMTNGIGLSKIFLLLQLTRLIRIMCMPVLPLWLLLVLDLPLFIKVLMPAQAGRKLTMVCLLIPQT